MILLIFLVVGRLGALVSSYVVGGCRLVFMACRFAVTLPALVETVSVGPTIARGSVLIKKLYLLTFLYSSVFTSCFAVLFGGFVLLQGFWWSDFSDKSHLIFCSSTAIFCLLCHIWSTSCSSCVVARKKFLCWR